jgi:hypothetical protein
MMLPRERVPGDTSCASRAGKFQVLSGGPPAKPVKERKSMSARRPILAS